MFVYSLAKFIFWFDALSVTDKLIRLNKSENWKRADFAGSFEGEWNFKAAQYTKCMQLKRLVWFQLYSHEVAIEKQHAGFAGSRATR